MDQIVIVDYGMGNIESVKNAFHFLGMKCIITDSREKIKNAKAIVLPGVGSFNAAMNNLHRMKLSDVLSEIVLNKKIPFLGICLGMQLIAQDSTEQKFSTGLGWINAHVTRMKTNEMYRIPHVGWNEVTYQNHSVLFNRIAKNGHFYFDHSYHLECDSDIVSATCDYDGKKIAAIEKEHIFAVQFHPEKSQRNGLMMIRNFLNYIAKGAQC